MNGSSRSKTSGRVSKARAIRARLPCPLLKKVTGKSSKWPNRKSVTTLFNSSFDTAPSLSSPSGALREFSSVFPKRKSLNGKSVISLLDSYLADRYADIVTLPPSPPPAASASKPTYRIAFCGFLSREDTSSPDKYGYDRAVGGSQSNLPRRIWRNVVFPESEGPTTHQLCGWSDEDGSSKDRPLNKDGLA
ncbi:hypothetical protein MHUMG1_04757 [Metarhizium humberi]|uniref:Uncharacterized protein n=1 Tax=Metarhizium humberi TaxID=2596975 RepID=A0A9P8S8I8_9HYPO|nr:hypothetical protein MHUMG1_04757 [Metarhizium humberi]